MSNESHSPPFDITDRLIDDLDDDFDIFRNRSEYADFKRKSKSPPHKKGGEVEFIRKFIPDLDGASGKDPIANLEIQISTKQFHKTPRVKFWWPGEKKFKGCELADLLLIITYKKNNQVVEMRSMLSQTKHTYDKKYKTRKQWDPNAYQFYLLHDLPKFYSAQPDLGDWYELDRKNSSFSNYSFVSDFWLPFFHSTTGMTENHVRYSKDQTKDYHYNRTDSPPSGYQSLIGYLKLFIRGRFGQRFTTKDRIYQFYSDLFSSNKEFDLSSSQNRLPNYSVQTDGGREYESPNDDYPEEPPREDDESSGLGLVHIVIGKNSNLDQEASKNLYFADDNHYRL